MLRTCFVLEKEYFWVGAQVEWEGTFDPENMSSNPGFRYYTEILVNKFVVSLYSLNKLKIN